MHKKIVINYVIDVVKKHWYVKVNVKFYGISAVKKQEEEKTFKLENKEIFITTNMDDWFSTKVMGPLLRDVGELFERDSGWTMMAINNL